LTIPDAGTPDAAQADLSDPNVVNQLRSFALQYSSLSGVSSPTAILAVAAADHQVAQTIISGAIVSDHSPVYVIEMTGGPFTSTHHPRGAPAPQGNALTLTLDARTLRIMDFGYHPVAPDLTQIGSVVNL
jgi:hypothetical protein